jgi:hypothetical protein
MLLPTPATKVTFCFQCLGYGWTTTLFLPTQSSNFGVETTKANTLASKFNASTNTETIITFVRLQSVANLRQGVIVPQNFNVAGPDNGLQPQACLYVRLYNMANTQSKLMFLRGLNGSLVQSGGKINPTAPSLPSIQQLIAQMVTDGWCWAGKALAGAPAPGPQLPPSKVGSVDTDGQGHAQISFINGIFTNFGPNNTVKAPLTLSGLQGCDTLNGQWVVYALSANQCVTVKQVLFNPWIAPSGWGHSALDTLVPIASGILERLAERKVGRPLFLSRGRSNRRKATY